MEQIHIKDEIYLPRLDKYNKRKTARCILLNKDNELGLLVVDRDDSFGKMIHYETPGGGVEENETSLQGLVREVREETGCEITNIVYIGKISNEYNLIHRIDEADFYLAFISDIHNTSYTDEEKELFKGMEWIPIQDYKKYYEKYPPFKVSHIIYKRDQIMIEKALTYLKENELL